MCGECGDMIHAGDRYFYTVYVADGEIRPHKQCIPCMGIRELLCPCAPWGYLWRALWDGVLDDPTMALFMKAETLSSAAKRKLLSEMDSNWEEE